MPLHLLEAGLADADPDRAAPSLLLTRHRILLLYRCGLADASKNGMKAPGIPAGLPSGKRLLRLVDGGWDEGLRGRHWA